MRTKPIPSCFPPSNVWFPLVYTTLSLPTVDDPLNALIARHWDNLEELESAEELPHALKYNKQLQAAFAGHTPDLIWQRIEQKKYSMIETTAARPEDLKGPEWAVLRDPQQVPHTLDFEASTTNVPPQYTDVIEQVVLVKRLREVSALIGFTRIESLSDYTEEVELPTEHIMRLSRKAPTWIPAAEVRGEGIFIQFREEAIRSWLQTPEMQRHNQRFLEAHKRWRIAHKREDPDANYPALRYVLLHTFAHALMRQLALESGYAAASIHERIYAQEPEAEGGAMAGVLLYTAASDSEGTLGGLVSLGEKLGAHIEGALEAMRYCASDPLCAEHVRLEDDTLHGATCHACLFAPETSCERGNRYLDRSVLVPTVERDNLAFFAIAPGR
ncbi:MAG TPA: DUF1998 domain-containing protein [Ktedonobacteraceae bacterium]|nr:DUF1998 domain-containing protein [Ktedonobacteraceae bacterium]